MEENTQKALDSAISQIEKDHGKGALMKLGAEIGRASCRERV